MACGGRRQTYCREQRPAVGEAAAVGSHDDDDWSADFADVADGRGDCGRFV